MLGGNARSLYIANRRAIYTAIMHAAARRQHGAGSGLARALTAPSSSSSSSLDAGSEVSSQHSGRCRSKPLSTADCFVRRSTLVVMSQKLFSLRDGRRAYVPIFTFCVSRRRRKIVVLCLVTIVHTKPVNSNFSPKIGCHGNVPQHLWTPIKEMTYCGHARLCLSVCLSAAVCPY